MVINGREKKIVLVDLDVVTVAFWDMSENADKGRALLGKIARGEVLMATPYYLLSHLEKWKHITLKEKIESCEYPVQILRDDQAILVQDGEAQLIGNTTEVKL